MANKQRSNETGRRILLVLVAGLGLACVTDHVMADSKHIVYIEASTVNRWKLDGFAARTGTDRYRFEALREYDFDKSRLVKQVLEPGKRSPDAVVVQECSVYFPGDLDAYKRQYRGWIMDIRARGLPPVIATIVPPASRKGFTEDTKDFIKERVLGRPSQYQQVTAFNEWLRALGKELGVAVFDLEQLLRISADDRHMRAEYNEGDGIHLNRSAYELLDRELQAFLDRLEWKAGRARSKT